MRNIAHGGSADLFLQRDPILEAVRWMILYSWMLTQALMEIACLLPLVKVITPRVGQFNTP
jgi:hypothetical protein